MPAKRIVNKKAVSTKVEATKPHEVTLEELANKVDNIETAVTTLTDRINRGINIPEVYKQLKGYEIRNQYRGL